MMVTWEEEAPASPFVHTELKAEILDACRRGDGRGATRVLTDRAPGELNIIWLPSSLDRSSR